MTDDAMTHRLHWTDSNIERSPTRLAYAGLPSLLGMGLALMHTRHLFADVMEGMPVSALVTGAIIPLVLALCLVLAGAVLWRSDLPTTRLRRIDGWVMAGMMGLGAVSLAIIIYQLLEGARLTHIDFVIMDFTTAGGIGGVLIGWYDSQNLQREKRLRIFREVVEHGGHCIYLTDTDGTIEYVNSRFETQTGYDRKTAIGRTPRLLKSGEQDEEFYEAMWETILAGNVWHAELINERKDGTHYHIDQTIAPVTDDDGRIERFVAINSDITELKRYEAQLERQNERLDEFASVVSHDLRNPLNVATGMVDLARANRDSEHLETAASSLSRMERLIDDVLTLARQGETVGDLAAVSLRSVSEAAWDHIEAEQATLAVQTDRSVEADRSRLQQLFENLFRNAIEHGGDGVTITVGEWQGGFVVQDTGPGFPEETHDRLFETGYTTAKDGTGLGLAIVKRIADAHGWEITASAGTDGGARIEITGCAIPQVAHK